MIDTENKLWLASHIFYSANLHKILVEAVKPLKEKILRSGAAQNYFFLRYWEKGQHIRLRFKGEAGILDNNLKQEINIYFEDYFKCFPSPTVRKSEIEERYISTGHLFPNNSVQYIDYEPEIERYGGNLGILISEKQFEMSSDAVLEILSGTDYNNDEEADQRAIGAAIQLHLAMLCAFRFTDTEIVALFEMIFKEWTPAAYRAISNDKNITFTGETGKYHQEYVANVFAERLAPLKKQLKPFIGEFIKALRENNIFEEQWLNRWYKDMKLIFTWLKDGINNNGIIFPGWYDSIQPRQLNGLNHKLGYLLRSYIHMTNNRVGVLNHNEALIASLIIGCIKEK